MSRVTKLGDGLSDSFVVVAFIHAQVLLQLLGAGTIDGTVVEGFFHQPPVMRVGTAGGD